MAEKLTDDALDAILDIVMEASGRLSQCNEKARLYWIDVTDDYLYEWCDRRSLGGRLRRGANATITS